MNERNNLSYINHILDAIRDIEESVEGASKSNFLKDKDMKDANIRRLEIIGEAVKNLSESFRNRYKNIPWREIVGTRDKMIHHYFGVDLDIVWDTINNNLPELKQKILKIKEDLEKSR